jgi:crotonobetainyl-CoA:carnitine CoA-transferase CaiB-like acyl-CoA transferase
MAHEHASGRGRPRHGAGAPEAPTALAGLRVLELADDTGAYCGKLLADLGADVVKIEPPGGDRSRALPPFWHDRPDPDHGLRFLYMNTGKRGVVLDLDDARDRDLLRTLARDSDLVIDTLPPGRLDALDCGWAALAAVNPRLVLTAITGFGQTGPRKDARSCDLVASALGGAMHVIGYADDPPVVLAGFQAHVMASTYAAVASLMALHHAAATGAGQLVDISVQDTVVSTTHICGVGKWRDDGLVPRRAGPGLFASVPSGAYRCKDGLVYLMVNRPLHWQALARWIHEETGVAEALDPMFEGPSSNRQPYRELLDVFIGDLAQRYTVAEMYHEGQRRHIAFTPVSTAGDVVCDPQLAARGFFVDVAHAGRGTLRMPGAPYRHGATPWRIARPAPRLGEHDAEILAPLRARDAAGTAPAPAPARTAASARGPRGRAGAATPDGATQRAGALAGVRVVEFTSAMAGPWVGRFMAHAGADVVRVESRTRPDVVRLYVPPRAPERGTQPQMSPWFTDWNAGKRFVALDLTHPGAVALAKRLVATADVVVENQRTGVMDTLGLGYEALRTVRPDLVMLATSGYGDSGPCARYVTWGPNIEALSSLATLSGFRGRDCTVTQYAYPDVVSALHGLVAVLAALRYRTRSGVGQYINLSQYEATGAILGPALTERAARGEEPARRGNGAAHAAPHGCYPCAGEDQWCAIAVLDDDDWHRFGTVVGAAWTREARFAAGAHRAAEAETLDELVGAWTRTLPAVEVAARLQAAGVAAGAVQTVEDVVRDPQLAARGIFEELPHLAQGTVVATGIPLGLTRTPGRSGRTGAAVGQDNDEVFAELLGMSAAEIRDAFASGAIEHGP